MTVDDWVVFEDWCTAMGRSALPTTWSTVQEFLVDVPCAPSTTVRRLGAIRGRHISARAQLVDAPPPAPTPTVWRPPGEPVDPADEDGPRWWGLAEALHHLPVHGYPHGLLGRRDALVLVVAARGWSRQRITDLRPAQVRTEPVPGIDDIDVPMSNHGLTCPSCAITRWLRVLAAWYDTSGPSADSVAQVVDDQPLDVRVHDCAVPVPGGWRGAPYLLPSIDRYGHVEHGTQIPSRRVTAIVSSRQRPTTDGHHPGQPVTPVRFPAIAEAPARPAPTPAQRAGKLREIDDVLDDLDTAMADAQERWEQILRRIDGESGAGRA